jgi:hypothetical protein
MFCSYRLQRLKSLWERARHAGLYRPPQLLPPPRFDKRNMRHMSDAAKGVDDAQAHGTDAGQEAAGYPDENGKSQA